MNTVIAIAFVALCSVPILFIGFLARKLRRQEGAETGLEDRVDGNWKPYVWNGEKK